MSVALIANVLRCDRANHEAKTATGATATKESVPKSLIASHPFWGLNHGNLSRISCVWINSNAGISQPRMHIRWQNGKAHDFHPPCLLLVVLNYRPTNEE